MEEYLVAARLLRNSTVMVLDASKHFLTLPLSEPLDTEPLCCGLQRVNRLFQRALFSGQNPDCVMEYATFASIPSSFS